MLINTVTFKYDVSNIKQKAFESMVLTMIHEIMHIMGWSSGAFQYWQDSRKTGDSKLYDVTTKTATLRGKSVTLVTTPEVVKTARSYFNCNTLEGLELEDQGGSGTAGSHWDERVAREDLMCGQIGGYKGITELTAAFFEDSGWYKITNNGWLHKA